MKHQRITLTNLLLPITIAVASLHAQADLQQLTDDPARDFDPHYSPDGTQIAFCSNDGGSQDIWLIPAGR